MGFIPRGNPPGRDRTSATGRAETGDWSRLGDEVGRLRSQMRGFTNGIQVRTDNANTYYFGAQKVFFSGARQIVSLDSSGDEVRVDLPSFDPNSVPQVMHITLVGEPDITSDSVSYSALRSLLYGFTEYILSVKELNSDGATYYLSYWDGAAWQNTGSPLVTSAGGPTATPFKSSWQALPSAMTVLAGIDMRVNQTGSTSNTDTGTVAVIVRNSAAAALAIGGASGGGGGGGAGLGGSPSAFRSASPIPLIGRYTTTQTVTSTMAQYGGRIECDPLLAGFTLTIPSASSVADGTTLYIIKDDSSTPNANVVTISPASGTIGRASTLDLPTNQATVLLIASQATNNWQN